MHGLLHGYNGWISFSVKSRLSSININTSFYNLIRFYCNHKLSHTEVVVEDAGVEEVDEEEEDVEMGMVGGKGEGEEKAARKSVVILLRQLRWMSMRKCSCPVKW